MATPPEYHYAGFGLGRGIETDEPLPFRRETFAAGLDDHARLVDHFVEAGSFEGREVLSVPRCGEILASVVVRTTSGAINSYFPFRCDVMRMVDEYRGVTRELYAAPEESSHLPSVVLTDSLVSLQLLEVRVRPSGAPRLAVLQRDIAFEPKQQKHWHSSLWTITRWSALGPDTEPRYAWVPRRGGPANEAELIERLAALYEARICREVRGFLDDGFPIDEMIAVLESNEFKGNFMGCFGRRGPKAKRYDPTKYPTIVRAIAETRPGCIPFAVMTEHYAGVRWLRLDSDGVPRLDTAPAMVAQAIEEVDPDETARFIRMPCDMGPSCREGFEGELDRLVTLTHAQLDAEIVLAGFEPEIERGRGPGLRKSVVEAIAARRTIPLIPEPETATRRSAWTR